MHHQSTNDGPNPSGTERIGNFAFSVMFSSPSTDGSERAAKRADAIAQWLIAQWLRKEETQNAEQVNAA